MSQTVQTKFGTGTVVDRENVRGRVSYRVEGPGFSTWIEATAMPLDFQWMPGPDDIQPNSVTLPYNPAPQSWVNPAEQNIQPGQRIDPRKRTAPADSVDFQEDGESYEPGPDPRLFATAGLDPQDVQAKLGPKYVNAFVEHDFTSLQARLEEHPEIVFSEVRERVGELVAQADQENLERVGRNERLEASDPQLREAAWKDVRAKAVRLRKSGQINLRGATPEVIAAQVTGDHGTYEVMVMRSNIFQGNSAVDSWTCECPWGQWAWKREHAFVGRMCSHAYASLMELQSLSKSKKPNPKFRNQPTVWASRTAMGDSDYVDAIVEFVVFCNQEGLSQEDHDSLDLYNGDDEISQDEYNTIYDFISGDLEEYIYTKVNERVRQRSGSRTAESLETVIDYARDNVYDTLAENGLDIHDPEAYDLIQETWRSSLGMYEDMYGLEIPQDVYERYASRTAAYDDVQPVIEMIADMGYAVGYDLHFSSMSNKWVMESKMLPEPLRGTTKATFGKNPWAGGGYSLGWTGKNLQFDSVEELQEAVRSLLSGNLASRTAEIVDLRPVGWDPYSRSLMNKLRALTDEGSRPGRQKERNEEIRELVTELRERGFDTNGIIASRKTAEVVPEGTRLQNKNEGHGKVWVSTGEPGNTGLPGAGTFFYLESNPDIEKVIPSGDQGYYDVLSSRQGFIDSPLGYGDIPDYGTTLDYILDHEVQKREDVEEPEFEYPAGGSHGVVNDINDGGGERTAALSLPKGTQVQRLNLDGSPSGQTGVVSRDHQGLTEWDQVTVLWDGDSQPSLNDFSEVQWGEYEDGTPTKRLDDPWNIHGSRTAGREDAEAVITTLEANGWSWEKKSDSDFSPTFTVLGRLGSEYIFYSVFDQKASPGSLIEAQLSTQDPLGWAAEGLGKTSDLNEALGWLSQYKTADYQDDYAYGEPPAYDSGDEYGGDENPYYVDPAEQTDWDDPLPDSTTEDDVIANFQRNAGWLMGNDGGGSGGNDDIAAAAEAHLRTAGRHFTMAEQQALIDEDDGKPYDRSGLRLDGTHYH